MKEKTAMAPTSISNSDKEQDSTNEHTNHQVQVTITNNNNIKVDGQAKIQAPGGAMELRSGSSSGKTKKQEKKDLSKVPSEKKLDS